MHGAKESRRQATPVRLYVAVISLLLLGSLVTFAPHVDLGGFSQSVVTEFRSTELGLLLQELPMLQQPLAYKSHDGVLEVSLTVEATRFNDGPLAFNTRTYNGMFPGPTLCAKPGDTLRITLINQLLPDLPSEHLHMNTLRDPNTTNLHFHGMHVSPSGIADNVLRTVRSGESMELVVKIPEHHPRGLFHYHPHHHGSTFLQMGGGMVGAISVQESVDQVDAVLILQAFSFSGGMLANLINATALSRSTMPLDARLTGRSHKRMANVFPDYQPRFEGSPENYPSFYVVNGQYHPRISLADGERKLFQVANAGPTQILELSVPGCDIAVHAKDAFPPAISTPEYVILTPGARVALSVQCNLQGKASGVFPFVSTPHADSQTYMGRLTDVYHGVLGLFEVYAASGITQFQPAHPNKGKNLMPIQDEDEHIERFHITFSSGPPQERDGIMYKSYFMNDQLFSVDYRYQMKLGVLHEWTLENVLSPDEKNHPFHLHSNPFQIVAMSHGHGLDYSVGDWRDTITLPYGGNTTIRFRPTDFTGLVAAHCHILGHADVGMAMLRREDPFRLFVAVLAIVTVASLFVLSPHLDWNGGGSAVQNLTMAQLDAIVASRPDLALPLTYKSHDGVLEVTLTVQPARFASGPVAFNTRSYNGMFPGPTLCAKPGDTLRITLINQLLPDDPTAHLQQMNTLREPNTTNLHFHGMHVSPSGVADNVLRTLASGESMEVIVEIPTDHPLGVYHYHPHHHGSVFMQMGGGMVGAISIQEDTDVVDTVLVLQAFSFKGGMMGNLVGAANVSKSDLPMDLQLTNETSHLRLADVFPAYQPRVHASAATYPSYYTINGQFHPRIRLGDGERKLFRIINAGPTQIIELHVPGCDVEVIAKDVFPPAETKPAFVLISPGARASIVVQCHLNGKASGVFPLVSTPHDESAAYMGRLTDVYHGVLGLFEVRADAAVTALALGRANVLPDLRGVTEADEPIERFHMAFSSGPPQVRDGVTYKSYYMNGELFSPSHRFKMRLNQLYEWTLENAVSSEQKNHPFHMHTNPFQIVALSHGHGVDHSVGDWRDTITLPFGGTATIRFRPTDFTGLLAAHCHILGHSDAGMIMLLEIQP
ncbi:hypothetical protein ACHHYP_09146 [Achlya hypogyna]|uniref:Multicopper oxidase n=1 Tax=Achlya hypogyna TaxID=1202772 RepID=A0A1V9YNN4_ACHHY|nr:hypothetical protein ACHHYP_09146 [Achlya hypogyna]